MLETNLEMYVRVTKYFVQLCHRYSVRPPLTLIIFLYYYISHLIQYISCRKYLVTCTHSFRLLSNFTDIIMTVRHQSTNKTSKCFKLL